MGRASCPVTGTSSEPKLRYKSLKLSISQRRVVHSPGVNLSLSARSTEVETIAVGVVWFGAGARVEASARVGAGGTLITANASAFAPAAALVLAASTQAVPVGLAGKSICNHDSAAFRPVARTVRPEAREPRRA